MNTLEEDKSGAGTETSPEKNNTKQFLIETAEIVVLALILTFIINLFTARVVVNNVSMQPTLHQGELVLVNKMAYKKAMPKTGDIIIFHAPPEPGEDFIKRVIGAPGDHVVIQEGNVYVNNFLLEEKYISEPPVYNGVYDVPGDKVFVLGDNRNASSDSHSWGFVPLSDIVGKALAVYWPINEFTLLTHKINNIGTE